MKPTTILLSVGLACGVAQASAQNFTVMKGAGQVGKNSKSYQAAVVKQGYPVGWWAKTGAGRMDVEFSPGNDFTLLPGSEAEITDKPSRGGSGLQRKVNLKNGSVVMELNGSGVKHIEVETPTAICGAVGTVFQVNAATSDFAITKGAVYLMSTGGDKSFVGEKISGNVSLDPGKENTSVSGNVNGRFSVNGSPVVTSAGTIDVAKASGGASNETALELTKPLKTNATWEITTDPTIPGEKTTVKTSTIPAGSYLMAANSTKLEKVTNPERKKIHSQYRAAAKTEGELVVKQKVYQASGGASRAVSSAQVNAAAKQATALRKALFNRKVIRNVATTVVRTINRPGGL